MHTIYQSCGSSLGHQLLPICQHSLLGILKYTVTVHCVSEIWYCFSTVRYSPFSSATRELKTMQSYDASAFAKWRHRCDVDSNFPSYPAPLSLVQCCPKCVSGDRLPKISSNSIQYSCAANENANVGMGQRDRYQRDIAVHSLWRQENIDSTVVKIKRTTG